MRGYGNLGGAIQRRPGGQGVHVVSPMHDFSLLNCDDRDESIFVRAASGKDFAVDFIFEDDDATVLRAVHDESVGGVNLDRLAVSGKTRHQIGAPSNRCRPARKVIERLEDCVFGERVEIMIAVDQTAQAFLDNFKERIESRENFVLRLCYEELVFNFPSNSGYSDEGAASSAPTLCD